MGRIPVYTATFPPGRAKAFTVCGSSMTLNSHGRSLRPVAAAIRVPTRVTRAFVAGAGGSFALGGNFFFAPPPPSAFLAPRTSRGGGRAPAGPRPHAPPPRAPRQRPAD